MTRTGFIDDVEKMRDLFGLSKDEFLTSYSYLTEEEYTDTLKSLYTLIKPFVRDTVQLDLCNRLIDGNVMWWVKCRENGDLIDCFNTREEAERTLEAYEEEDKRDGTYTENFYEVWNG